MSTTPVIHKRSSSLPTLPPVPPLKLGTKKSMSSMVDAPTQPLSPMVFNKNDWGSKSPAEASLPTPAPTPEIPPPPRPRQAHKSKSKPNLNKSLPEIKVPLTPPSEMSEAGSLTPPSALLPPPAHVLLNSPPSLVYSQTDSISSDDAQFATFCKIQRKHNAIRELYLTEKKFAADLDVVIHVYMCTCFDIGLSDRRIYDLFSNLTEVLDTSLGLVAMIETMVDKSVLHPQGSSHNSNPLNDPETHIGQAMCTFLNASMYRVYEEYSHRNTKQMKVCFSLPTDPQSRIGQWLLKGRKLAYNHTAAWSLDALLIKPVQRLAKYPLLLRTLLENTASDHPDYRELEIALGRSTHYVECVNARFGYTHYLKQKKKY